MKRKITFLAGIVVLTLVLSTLTAVPAFAIWEANTVAGITGPTEPVPAGSLVTLTVTENNNGGPDYWITEPWMSLEPGGYILNKASYYVGGDVDDDGILDVGETWQWQVNVIVNEDTMFTAIGHGWARGWTNIDITYGVLDPYGNMAFPDEKYELWVYVIPPPSGEGLTPGYWKNHLEDWPPTGYSPSDSYDAIFGVVNHLDSGLTLGQTIGMNGGGEKALMRHATAALLSAAHPNIEYPLTISEVIAIVQAAYAPGGDFTDAKDILAPLNELEGDITS
jgi:hypothetical protein